MKLSQPRIALETSIPSIVNLGIPRIERMKDHFLDIAEAILVVQVVLDPHLFGLCKARTDNSGDHGNSCSISKPFDLLILTEN